MAGVILGLLIFGAALPISAQTDNIWHGADEQARVVLSATDWSTAQPESTSGVAPNEPCQKKRIALNRVIGINYRYRDGCWYDTKLGLLDSGGLYILLPGEQVAAKIDMLASQGLRPTKNPDVFYEHYHSGGIGTSGNMYFVRAVAIDFIVNRNTNGSMTAVYSRNTELRSGAFIAQRENMFMSSNGQWLLTYKEGYGRRLNLQTMDQVAYSLHDGSKYDYAGSAAISDDGRYLIGTMHVSSWKSYMRVADLEACGLEEARVDPVSKRCTSTLLAANLLQFVPSSGTDIRYLKFYSNSSIGGYIRHAVSGQLPKYKEFFMYAPGAPTETSNYLAMGDSFASGEGAWDYIDGTDDHQTNKCHVSRQSYPYLIDSSINVTSFHSVACSGARTSHVIDEAQEKDSAATSEWHPGTREQLSFFDLQKPDIVTVSIGGNDIGFSDKLSYCLTRGVNCYDTYEKRARIVAEIKEQYPSIVDAYKKIKQNAAANAKIYALGYPQIINDAPGISCGNNVSLSANERKMAYELVVYLNDVIRHAATAAGVMYVDIENALQGVRLCDNVASAQIGVNGLTRGQEIALLIGRESYHPNQIGHQRLKGAILEATDNFNLRTNNELSARVYPDADEYGFLQDVIATKPISSEPVRPFNFDLGSRDTVHLRSENMRIQIQDPTAPTQANAVYDVVLHSEPRKIAEVKTDGAGQLDAEVLLPDDIEPGIHELHIIGPGADGTTIDLYQLVYIGAMSNDFYGDGISNDARPCGLIPASGDDIDKDGIDDACDSHIGDAPVDPGPTPGPESPVSALVSLIQKTVKTIINLIKSWYSWF